MSTYTDCTNVDFDVYGNCYRCGEPEGLHKKPTYREELRSLFASAKRDDEERDGSPYPAEMIMVVALSDRVPLDEIPALADVSPEDANRLFWVGFDQNRDHRALRIPFSSDRWTESLIGSELGITR
ncbi:hypothetical protein [Brevibacterium sp.]|uniref:hypothetical protein n=1 Tax=Brevibacterium sp. TaxID=1701 RepID=UPI0028120F12|nr:hypothetical protein [Brevibacterium sp.]